MYRIWQNVARAAGPLIGCGLGCGSGVGGFDEGASRPAEQNPTPQHRARMPESILPGAPPHPAGLFSWVCHPPRSHPATPSRFSTGTPSPVRCTGGGGGEGAHHGAQNSRLDCCPRRSVDLRRGVSCDRRPPAAGWIAGFGVTLLCGLYVWGFTEPSVENEHYVEVGEGPKGGEEGPCDEGFASRCPRVGRPGERGGEHARPGSVPAPRNPRGECRQPNRTPTPSRRASPPAPHPSAGARLSSSAPSGPPSPRPPPCWVRGGRRGGWGWDAAWRHLEAGGCRFSGLAHLGPGPRTPNPRRRPQ